MSMAPAIRTAHPPAKNAGRMGQPDLLVLWPWGGMGQPSTVRGRDVMGLAAIQP